MGGGSFFSFFFYRAPTPFLTHDIHHTLYLTAFMGIAPDLFPPRCSVQARAGNLLACQWTTLWFMCQFSCQMLPGLPAAAVEIPVPFQAWCAVCVPVVLFSHKPLGAGPKPAASSRLYQHKPASSSTARKKKEKKFNLYLYLYNNLTGNLGFVPF